MSKTLQITSTLQVTPLFDIQYQDVAQAYGDGLHCRLQAGRGPVAISSLFNAMQEAIASRWFDGRHEAQLHHLVGFIFGEIHSQVLTVHGTRRPDVTTLVTLDSQDGKRGYHVGREWYFYEAQPDERQCTDDSLIERLRELALESLRFRDEERTMSYALGCVLGELSGPLFPETAQETQAWEAQRQKWLEEYSQLQSTQAYDTDPLPAPVRVCTA